MSSTDKSLLLLGGIVLALLTVTAVLFDHLPLDPELSHLVQSRTPKALEPLMLGASWLGGTYPLSVVGLATAGLLAARGRWPYVPAPFMLGTLALLVPLLKEAIGRPRPSGDLVDVYFRVESASFPSGHAFMSVCIFGGLYYLADQLMDSPLGARVLRWGAVLAILTIGASRIYLGVHWASDVAGGFLMGLLALLGAIRLFEARLLGRRG